MRYALLAALVLLAGCQSPQEYQESLLIEDAMACQRMGMQGAMYQQCILQQQAIRENRVAQNRQAAAVFSAAMARPQPVIMPNPVVRCTSSQSFGNVYTTCR